MLFVLLVLACTASVPGAADWPTLRGNPQRTGYVDADLPHALRLAWAAEFDGERLGTAMEPILGGGRIFVATHAGRLWALDAMTGAVAWRFDARTPLLHSPAYADGRVIAATADGRVLCLAARSGRLDWQYEGESEGYSASPLLLEDHVFIGSREGTFVALELESGIAAWEHHFDVPIRQSAAAENGRVWITLEDLTTHCLATKDGRVLWKSPPVNGQSARDYYPVLVHRNGRRQLVVRTSPALNMAQLIHRNRNLLARNAGLDDSDWRRIESWTTNVISDVTPEAARREQDSILDQLGRDPNERTCFAWDADGGQALATPPLLWLGGCQGVAAPPVALPDGRLFTLLRTAYGHWSLGVAPLVGLGCLDLASNRVELFQQKSGPKPPWNTFWGTADEAQNLLAFRDAVLFVHQGTLSRFNPATGKLEPILGERDTFGGFRHPTWARNEWHGPARGGAAWSEGRLYWLTGSRVLCLATNEGSKPTTPRSYRAGETPSAGRLTPRTAPTPEETKDDLADAVRELTGSNWAPLTLEPGLAGRSVFFDNPGETLEIVTRAWPHLASNLQERIEGWLPDNGMQGRGPFGSPPWRSPSDGDRREYTAMPRENLRRLPADASPMPFGNVAAIVAWCRRTDPSGIADLWPELHALWESFQQSGWHLDPKRGDLFANRYLTSLRTFAEVARDQNETEPADAAQALADETATALVAWWEKSAKDIRLGTFNGSSDLDAFINSGDGLFFKVAPHRHRLALFQDLNADIGALLHERAPAAIDTVWRAFETLCPTWWLVGEEPQVHNGENFIDTPDFAMAAFRALAYLRHTSTPELASRVDIPAARGDLYYVAKLAIVLDAASPATKRAR